MTDWSRRTFLTKASLGVAAGVAATVASASGVATVESLLAAPPAPAGGDAGELDVTAVGEDVVAHVRNASTGEVSLMVGHHELVYQDRALVSRLLKGARLVGREA